MPQIKPLDPRSTEAKELVTELDDYLNSLYPPESNHLDSLDELAKSHVHFLGAYEGGQLVGCGALKIMDGYAELKRMYVRPAARGKGFGRMILHALEALAAGAGTSIIRLEAGIHQPEALRAYARHGYRTIPPFGDYPDDPLSVYMEKTITIPI